MDGGLGIVIASHTNINLLFVSNSHNDKVQPECRLTAGSLVGQDNKYK
jgi:hypothetical protein